MSRKASKKLRCAVIGAGKMGSNHIRVYSELSDIEFIAIAEIDEKSGKASAEAFGVKYYKEFEDMLEKEDLDVISICVPSSFHYNVAMKCIEKKTNILLEKPIATSVKEGEELLKRAKKKRVKMLVGHIERFNPAVIKLKEILNSGKLGKITSIISRRVGGFPFQIRDTNIMVDLAIHDIDIINYLMGELPVEISINKQRIHTKTLEDSVEFFLKYKVASAYIQANWITPVKIRTISISGSEGYMELDYISQQIEYYKSNYEKFKDKILGFSDYILRFADSDKQDINVVKKEPLKEEIKYLIAAVQNNTAINSQFALDALKIALYNK